MKKILLFLCCLLYFQSIIFAQEETTKFRLELTTQSIFTQGFFLRKTKGRKTTADQKYYHYDNQISAF